MAKIKRVSWRPFRIPFREEFRASHGVMEAREGYVVILEDTVGRIGLGEASPLPSFAGGSMPEVGEALERVARTVLRWQAHDIFYLRDDRRGLLTEKAHVADVQVGSLGPVLSAFQCAAVDQMGRTAGVPFYATLAKLLAAIPMAPQPAAIPVNAVLGLGTPEQAAADAVARVSEGFETLKLKLGRDADADCARIEAVRAAVGPDVRLRFDANAAWSEPEARERLPALVSFAPELVEQPLPPGPDAVSQMRDLDRETGVLIALDESLVQLELDVQLLGDLDKRPGVEPGCRAGVLKPALVSLEQTILHVILPWVQHDVRIVVTTSFDTGIATALAMHLAALLPEPRLACGLDTLRFLEGDIVTGVPAIEHGQVSVSDRPGLGVELDEAALERYATGPWKQVRS